MYSSTITQVEQASDNDFEEDDMPSALPCHEDGEQPFIWRNILGLAVLHVLAVSNFILYYDQGKLNTWIFTIIWGLTAGLGITAGAHRLWAHRSYAAKLPLRIFLAVLFCMAGMTHFHKWIRDHRTHHKYTETSADPHNANRGFFFSHVGWLMMKRHPAVKMYGSKIDMSDIEADPVIRFFDKYYELIMCSLTFVMPTLIPVYGWNETWYVAIHAVIIRYVWLLNATFLVNSFAHMWGNRPYNRNIKPTENGTVSFFTLGEGWHNYHHSFPWDYKAAELPGYGLNPSTAFIETMAFLGLAYDLKTPSRELVEKVSINKGDGSASNWGLDHHQPNKKQ
ncbi:acyl-CoA Delta-9 desaturase-like isoform X2 [Phymastichus coffea]|nr:acyl-CoA Delta-9 desaturase-like isoform X2 [Phymastichus coffea]